MQGIDRLKKVSSFYCSNQTLFNYSFYCLTILLLLFPFSLLKANDIINSYFNEINADWAMYQCNAQHTGYNEESKITVQLQLIWNKKYQTESYPINQPNIIGDKLIVTYQAWKEFEATLPVRVVDSYSGETIWAHYIDSLFDMSPPAYGYGIVYCYTNYHSSKIYTFNFEDGTPIWDDLVSSQWTIEMGPVVYVYYFLGSLCIGMINHN